MKLESNPQEKTITARGLIGDYEGCISADDFLTILAEHRGEDVTILLNSEGGSVTDGLSIYNALRAHEGEVTIHVDSIAASIATVICCAADHVKMNANAKFMIHRCWTQAVGNCTDFRKMAQIMEMLDADIASTYAEKTGKETEILMEMMDDETWLTAEQALEAGFIDSIHGQEVEVKAEVEAPVIKASVPPALIKARLEAMNRRLRLSR